MTRAEHLTWCKKRALEYLDGGDLANAVASMVSDLKKHPECRVDPVLALIGFREAQAANPQGVRLWVEGFQ